MIPNSWARGMRGGRVWRKEGSAMEKTRGPLFFLPHVGPLRCF